MVKKIFLEAIAKLHATGKSMILTVLARGSLLTRAPFSQACPAGQPRKRGRKGWQKDDFYWAKSLAIASLFFACVALAGCARKAPQGPTKPLLLVSLPPYQTLVQQIAGEGFEVQAVVPLNADPHNYEPTSKQLSGIAEGQVWFRIGESFEQKLLPLLKKTKTVDLRQDLPMIGGACKHHDHEDRHLWLSPKLMALQAGKVTAVLSEQFPEQKGEFETHLSVLQEQLKILDHQIVGRLHGAEHRIFLVSHPAFAYFCRDYDCRQLSVEHEGKEPRPKELEETLNAAIANHAALAIALPQHNNKGAQLIAEKLRIPVRFIDPYAADYFDTMRKLSELIANPYYTNS